MDTLSDTENLLLASVVVIIVFGAIWLIERRVKREGNLFTKPPTATMRIFAGLLGLVFAIIAIYEWTSSTSIELMLLLAACGLIAYSLGATDLLIAIQGGPAKSQPNLDQQPVTQLSTRPILRLLFILLMGVAGIAVAIYGSALMLAQANAFAPLFVICGIAIVGFIPLRYLGFLIEVYRVIKKHDSTRRDL